MERIALILLLLITCTWSSAQTLYKIEKMLDVEDAYTFDKNHFGIIANAIAGRIEVRIYDKKTYTTGGRNDYASLLYGVYADENSTSYQAKSWTINYPQSWVCNIAPFLCDTPSAPSDNYQTRFIKAGKLEAEGTTLGDMMFWTDPQIPVIIELEVYGSSQLDDIVQLNLPGIGLIESASFLNSSVLDIFNNPLSYPNYAFVAAHRGYWADPGVSENTIHACRLALGLGADMLEVDIRTSGDGVPMLLHDPCLYNESTSQKDINIKTLSASELMNTYTYDRFGNITQYKINSLEQLFDSLGTTTLITLDIKDTGDDWDDTFKKCLQLIWQEGLFSNVIIKGKADREAIEELMAEVDPTMGFDRLMYTPVLYGDSYWKSCYGTPSSLGSGSSGSGGSASGLSDPTIGFAGSGGPGNGDGSSSGGVGAEAGQFSAPQTGCLEDFKRDWYPLIKSGQIKAVETHFKLNSDPLIYSGVVKWLKENGARVGMFIYTADSTLGVANTNNSCQTTIREYWHDNTYEQHQKSEFLNDGRGNLDWVFRIGKPDYIIHDRPDLLLDYLRSMNFRSLSTPMIQLVALPDEIELRVPPNDAPPKQPFTWPSEYTSEIYTDLNGIAIKINNYQEVDFFVPNTIQDQVKASASPVEVGLNRLPEQQNAKKGETFLPVGVTKENVQEKFYNGYDAFGASNSTCGQIYENSTQTDEKGQPFPLKFKFPNKPLNEWASIYEGYEVYLNSNYWATNGYTGNQTASERPEFWLPCTDIYGLLVSDGVVLSDTVDMYDPSGRTRNACLKDINGNCISGTEYDGRFDAVIFYQDGEVEIVSIDQMDQGYLNLDSLVRQADNKAIKHAIAGYQILSNGQIISRSDITQKFNNEQIIKQRTIMGINTSNKSVYITTINDLKRITKPNAAIGGLSVEQAAQLMKDYFGCDMAINMDSGKSVALITSVGNFPNIKAESPSYLGAGTDLNGIDQRHLTQFFGEDAQMVYRNIATFLAIKSKNR